MHYRLTARALAELHEITTTIELDDPTAAKRIANRIEQLLTLACDVPRLGRICPDQDTYRLPVRPFPCLIFYQIRGNELQVLSIFNTRRNPTEQPPQETTEV